MSTVDALGANSKRPLGVVGVGNEQFVQYRAAKINFADVIAVGTKKIFILPARSFVTHCWFVVTTAWTSDGSATMQIDESSGSATYISLTDGPKADMTAGTVIKGGNSNDGVSTLNTVAGSDDEYDTSERTIDFVTGTAAWTAGEGILVVQFITLDDSAD